MDRRTFLALGGLCLAGRALAGGAGGAAGRPGGEESAAAGEATGEAALAAIEAAVGGRLGVLALDTGDGRELVHRPDERFALCSTFKWMLAAQVLERVDGGELTLERRVSFGPGDLLEYAPVAREHAAAGWLSVEALCRAVVTVSDNTAANLLLALVGGPAGLTAFLRRHGDGVTRLDRDEPSLNTNLPGDPRDTTTPRAMVASMRRILLGDVLAAASRDRLLGWLADSTTGRRRLRAGLPPAWRAGDKTGTGARGAANDVAVAWPPERPPILVAAYLSDSTAPLAELDAAHAAVGRLVALRLG